MKQNFLTTLLMVTSLSLIGCGGNSTSKGGGNSGSGNPTDGLPTQIEEAINSSKFSYSQELKDSLAYMGNEERLAYDVYNEMYAKSGIKQFTNIASKSEIKHIEAVQKMVRKYELTEDDFSNVDLNPLGYRDVNLSEMNAGRYDIAKIKALYDDLIALGSGSEIDAFKVGCTVEVVDVEDLDKYITLAKNEKADDLVTVFDFLRDGSYKHYWAFDKGMKKKGYNEGCCTWSELCHTEYPQK